MIGTTISHYKILEKLGEGGMGEVYKAEDTKLKRTVALKFLTQQALGSEDEKTRFIHEAQAAAVLDHPNICTVYEIDEVEKRTFISMACIEGQSLKEKIKSGKLMLGEAVEIAIQIAEGLRAAHDEGIVHRDIKTGNIMLTSKGQAKITDFGLAKLSERTTLTRTDTVMGTVAYMSPEQARGEAVDHHTDIWSLGVVLYEMITGQLPFKSEYEQAVIYSILNEDPKPVTDLNKGIPESLNTIVTKALEKNPANRYQNMGEILTDLKRVKQGLGVSTKPRIKRKTKWAILSSLALVLTVILVTYLWQIPTEKRIPEKIPIGVMFFDNQTGEDKYDYLRKALAQMLITDLSQSRYLRVMTLESMYDLLDSLGYEGVEVINASLGFELCQLAGARRMVLGSLVKSGNTFVLNTQVLDVSTKESIAPPYRVTGEGEGSILGNLVDDLTDKIKRGLEISIKEIRKEKTDIADLTTTSLEAYEYYFAGREAAFRMRRQEAIDNLEKAITLDSAFIEAYDILARQYYTMGENAKALKVIEKAKSFSSKLPERKLVEFLAVEAYIKHNWELAIGYYQRLTSINPEDISAHLHLGMIYYQYKGMTDEGIAEFEKVLELCRKGAVHYTNLTQEEIKRNLSFTHNVMGWAFLRKGELKKAHEAFKKYVALLPNQAYPLTVLGDFYLISGDYDQAITNFQRSLQIDSNYALALLLLGEVYLAKGMYVQAMDSYDRFLALSISETDKAEGHYYLAKLNYLKGDYDRSIQQCDQSLKLNPLMIEAHWIMGLTLLKKGKLEQAESEVSVIKELIGKRETEDPKTYYYHLLGELSLVKGLNQQALENFNRAADIKSLDRAFFMNASGKAYFETGNLNEAVEKLRGVLQINQNYAQTHYLLGLVYEKKGKKGEAKEHFQRFLQIWKDADENLPRLIEAKKRLKEL